MFRQFSKFNRKYKIILAVVGDAPLMLRILIQQIILYSETTLQQYLEHRHMEAGLLTWLSRSPLRLDPLLSSKAPILTQPHL